MPFKHFWRSIVAKSACIPEIELAGMTAGEVVAQRKRRKLQPPSNLRWRALRRIIFLEDIDTIKDKTFAELAHEYLTDPMIGGDDNGEAK